MKCQCKILNSWKKRSRKGDRVDGRSSHKLYRTWASMLNRCKSNAPTRDRKYSGRGIGVCERWVEDFYNFVEDMSPRPKGKTLDRKNNEEGYCYHNCRWASPLQQGKNRRGYVSKGLPRGVYKNTNGAKYAVRFSVLGKHINVGYFNTIREASMASLNFRNNTLRTAGK